MRFDGHHELRTDVRYAVPFCPLAEVKRFQSRTENAASSHFSTTRSFGGNIQSFRVDRDGCRTHAS
jgi:hypothetical protein